MIGIPYFYRLFGYEYAIDIPPALAVPDGPRSTGGPSCETPVGRLRVARPTDLPALTELQDAAQARFDVRMPHSPPRRRWLLEHEASTTWVLERAGGPVATARTRSGDEQLLVAEAAAVDPAAAEELLRHVATLAPQAPLRVVQRVGTVTGAAWHALTAADPAWLAEQYYVRIPDPAILLDRIRPVLWNRLVAAGLDRSSGDVVLSTFRRHYRIPVEDDGLGTVDCQMRRAVALLAAASLLAGVAGCGGDGAEPGVPRGAILVLDFTPNAVHSGIYAARERGLYRAAGVDLEIRQPGESTDAPKLLAAGRAEFAILDIHDLGIARERGLDLVGLLPIVQRPLAAVIARGDGAVRRPRDLEGDTVGVTGLPSDEAVVDSEVERRRRRPGGGRAGDDRLQRDLLAGRGPGRGRDRLLERRGRGPAPAGRPDPHLQGRRVRRPRLPRARPHDLAGGPER